MLRAAPIPARMVTHWSVAAFFVVASAWSVSLRVRHVSARSRVPEYFLVPRLFHGAAGLTQDLLLYAGIVIILLGLFSETRDRVERAGIAACFASVLIQPLPMMLPACASAVWWVDFGFLLAFLLASVRVLVRLSRSERIDPRATT